MNIVTITRGDPIANNSTSGNYCSFTVANLKKNFIDHSAVSWIEAEMFGLDGIQMSIVYGQVLFSVYQLQNLSETLTHKFRVRTKLIVNR